VTGFVGSSGRCRPTRISLGIVGIGIAAISAYLPVLATSEDFELTALCDTNPDRLVCAREWPESAATQDLDELLRVKGLQAVIIATPPDSHVKVALKSIAAGKHVLIEKPLAPTVNGAEKILEAARRAGVRVAVNHEKRFHPTLRKISGLLKESIGRPYFFGVHWASNVKLAPESFVPEGFAPGYRWRWSSPAVGGGIVQDHLPHYVDLIQNWTGAKPTAVYAQLFNIARDMLAWPAAESVWEDMGLVITRFSNGAVLRLETGVVGRSLSPLWSLGSGVGEWTEYGYVLGTQGQLVFDLLPWDSSENGRIALWELRRAQDAGTGWAFVEQPEPARRRGSPAGAAHAMFSDQLAEFARLVQGEPSTIATGEDGLATVAAVEAAYKSVANGSECELRRLLPDIYRTTLENFRA